MCLGGVVCVLCGGGGGGGGVCVCVCVFCVCVGGGICVVYIKLGY